MSDALKELIRQLASEDPSEREASALELAGLGDPQVAPLLLHALGDPADPVRRWSAYGLAKLGRPQDASALRGALEKDPSAAVRIQAALGLVRMGEQPALGRVAQLLTEQEPGERALLYINLAVLFPELAIPTLDALAPAVRREVMDRVFQAAERLGAEEPALQELSEKLRARRDPSMATPTIEEMPAISVATPTIKEMPAIPLPGSIVTTMEMVAVDSEPPESVTAELEIPEEEEELDEDEGWSYEPPEAQDVALRALALGGLLRRLALEERIARGKDSAAKQEISRLQRWMEEQGFFGELGVSGLELFETEPGSWSEEDRQAVAWSAEQLQLLLWVLKQGKLPPLEARVESAPLLERLPLGKDPQPFMDTAERRPLEEVMVQRERWEVLLECARYESFARGILADESLAREAPELDAVLDSAEAEGFDRQGMEAKRGRARAAAEGLRYWCRSLVTRLQREGLLPGEPGEGLVFQGKRLVDVDEKALATLLALAQARYQVLEWLTEGDEGLDDVPPAEEPF